MIEHPAVPNAANSQRDTRHQSGARPGNHSGGGPGRYHAADAGDGAHNMANVVKIERQNMREQGGDNVEQPAVEIKIAEIKNRSVGKTAAVIGDDQVAVMLLEAFVV